MSVERMPNQVGDVVCEVRSIDGPTVRITNAGEVFAQGFDMRLGRDVWRRLEPQRALEVFESLDPETRAKIERGELLTMDARRMLLDLIAETGERFAGSVLAAEPGPPSAAVITPATLKQHMLERMRVVAPLLSPEEIQRDLRLTIDPADGSRVLVSAEPGTRVFDLLARAYPDAVQHDSGERIHVDDL